MKVLLVAINAKYIHSNLAVYSLKAYAKKYEKEVRADISIEEYTINQPVDAILADLYEKKPDVLCFSCYIWNIVYMQELLVELRKILPVVKIWLGGPEVSYHAVELLRRYPQVDGIMRGEGEETFLELLRSFEGENNLEEIVGITWRERNVKNGEGEIRENSWRPAIDLNKIPFVYQNHMEMFANKMIYYESSRGCPFSCSYCLSSIDKCLRFRDLELVFQELQFFIDQKVAQVKFVDRTFNCRHEHAIAIWRYLAEHDLGITNFHFEVAADLLQEEELQLLEKMRPGLVQLEIGIQSTNARTICEIQRSMDFERVAANVKRIHNAGNIHQHLDLIAGLPYEDYESFHQSFDSVYALQPEQLQLGFLKVLKGSHMQEMASKYDLVYQERPSFEVLSTRWLSYGDIVRLKRVEEMVEVYYNSGQFVHTLPELVKQYRSPFAFFEALGNYYLKENLFHLNHTRIARYEILLRFAKTIDAGKLERYRELLTFDLYLRENVKNRPDFCGEFSVDKKETTAFYEEEAKTHQYLKGYESYDRRQMRKMTHLERLDGKIYLFDYMHRNPLTNQAKVLEIGVDCKMRKNAP
ncbi:MAG: B12-binding domain-containing radical SAM protein [Hespellia sp.]|nr:B12-binding domain-containing radical SAM protein [Hespellia sp.]